MKAFQFFTCNSFLNNLHDLISNLSLQVSLWYDAGDRPPTPEDPSEPIPYDRITNNQQKFFEIFADFEAVPPTLDYTQMVQSHTFICFYVIYLC